MSPHVSSTISFFFVLSVCEQATTCLEEPRSTSALSPMTFPLLPVSSSQPTDASGILIAPLPPILGQSDKWHQAVKVEAETADVVQAKPPGSHGWVSSSEAGHPTPYGL